VIILRLCATLFHPRSFTQWAAARAVLSGLLLSTVCATWTPSAADGTESASKHGEKPYALIFGTVWGPNDYPLYGVKVKIRRFEEKKTRWEVYSNRRGEFEQRLPVGPANYLVWADLKGYKTPNSKQLQPGEEVKVHVDKDERVDIGLHLK
jgi:hypothetical protein